MNTFVTMPLMSTFGEKLSAHLDKIGMSKYRLYKLSGASESYIVNVTNGVRKPSDELLQKISRVKELGLSYGTLLMWKLVDEFGIDAVSEMISLAEKELGSRSQKGSSAPLE